MNINKKEIIPLTSFRFMAAFYVFIFHCQIHFGYASSISLVNDFISLGYLGMVMFFILSGYILSYNYNEFKTSKEVKKFYINRLARVYPIYLVYGLIGFPLFLLNIGNIDATLDVEIMQVFLSLFAFIFMIQAWFPTLFNIWNFGGSWSLSVEAFFYILFPIIRICINDISEKNLKILFFFSYILASIPVLYLYGFSNTTTFPIMNTYLYINPMFRIGEFLFGSILFVIAQEKRIINFNKILFFGLLMLFIILNSSVSFQSLSVLNFIFVPLVGLFILYLHSTNVHLFSNIILAYLGRVSYSFYLAQFFVFAIIKSEIVSINITMLYKWILAFTITLFIAVLVYHFVEKPARLQIKKLI